MAAIPHWPSCFLQNRAARRRLRPPPYQLRLSLHGRYRMAGPSLRGGREFRTLFPEPLIRSTNVLFGRHLTPLSPRPPVAWRRRVLGFDRSCRWCCHPYLPGNGPGHAAQSSNSLQGRHYYPGRVLRRRSPLPDAQHRSRHRHELQRDPVRQYEQLQSVRVAGHGSSVATGTRCRWESQCQCQAVRLLGVGLPVGRCKLQLEREQQLHAAPPPVLGTEWRFPVGSASWEARGGAP